MSQTRKRTKKTEKGRHVPAGGAGRAAVVHRLAPGPASPKSRQPRKGCYVYGVIESRSPVAFGRSTLGGVDEDVYTVHAGDLAAVVSHIPVSILDPTRDNALAHERVIEAVMKHCTIIPMSFGTVFHSDGDVRELLRSLHAPFREALERMDGKLEFGLKVTWDRDCVMKKLKRGHEDIRRFHQELIRRGLQSKYFARMELGLMIEKALSEEAAYYQKEIREALNGICDAFQTNKTIGEKMILNAACLVQRRQQAGFEAVLNRLAHKFRDGLHFKLNGPWPPYNFVNIRLKVEQRKAG